MPSCAFDKCRSHSRKENKSNGVTFHTRSRNELRQSKEKDTTEMSKTDNVKFGENQEQETGECSHSENMSEVPEVESTACEPLPSSLFENLNQDTYLESCRQDNVLEIEMASPAQPPQLSIGRRIVDINHFYRQLQKNSIHGPLDCGLNSIDIVGEKRIGLRSKFTFVCKLCNHKFYIETEPPNDIDINHRAVAGTISIGCGHSQLEELSAALDLPLLCPKTYQKCHKYLTRKWEEVALDTMIKAAETERNLAISEGRVDRSGIPVIDVIVDGCWSKRTYKKNYSALSGAAAIIGKRTGQILFLGVKNKYCCICLQAEKKGRDPKEHICYRNYSGSSTGMESAILVEGFKASIEMHNLIYGRMVSDGDSSTYSKLLQSRPYPHVTVQKIECRNHILRNLCNKIENLKTDTKYPLRFRKYISQSKILVIRKIIRMAIRNYKSDDESERNANIELLYNDILLAHLHAFENHSKCKSYFCSKEPSSETIDHDLFTSSLWSRICLILSNVASHSPSLIHDVDSNAVERYNSIVAKLVGGKRINFSLKGSYQTRCQAAVVSFNTNKVLSSVYKSIAGKSPKGKIRLLEQRRLKKRQLMVKYLRKKQRLFTKGPDLDYGEQCTKPDMSPEMYEKEKATFLENLRKSEEDRDKIQKATVLQSGSSEWMELRRNLLTASNFGKVIKRRMDVSCQNLVKNLLYNKNCLSNVKSLQYGKDSEKIALKQLSQQENVEIKACGLFIDSEIPYLGASPDGIINKDYIVEVKCPITLTKLEFDEAVSQKKITFYKKKGEKLEINKNHEWFYQVQGQLHITKASKCLFAIWQGENKKMITETIRRDDIFWENVMKGKLVAFYLDCLLPELVDPRNTRSMPIRDPDYIKKAIENKQNKERKRKKVDSEAMKEIHIERVQMNAVNMEDIPIQETYIEEEQKVMHIQAKQMKETQMEEMPMEPKQMEEIHMKRIQMEERHIMEEKQMEEIHHVEEKQIDEIQRSLDFSEF